MHIKLKALPKTNSNNTVKNTNNNKDKYFLLIILTYLKG